MMSQFSSIWWLREIKLGKFVKFYKSRYFIKGIHDDPTTGHVIAYRVSSTG
ncbi:hypothetical protein MASR2M15_07270 [Anaerolineales bacterium]